MSNDPDESAEAKVERETAQVRAFVQAIANDKGISEEEALKVVRRALAKLAATSNAVEQGAN